jgi:hypothetical protein
MTDEGGTQSEELRIGEVQLQWYCGGVAPTTLCAMGTPRGSPCRGDSGGPLLVDGAEGGYVQVGVVSYGLQAQDCDDPTAFTFFEAASSALTLLPPHTPFAWRDACACSDASVDCVSNGVNVTSQCDCLRHTPDNATTWCWVVGDCPSAYASGDTHARWRVCRYAPHGARLPYAVLGAWLMLACFAIGAVARLRRRRRRARSAAA